MAFEPGLSGQIGLEVQRREQEQDVRVGGGCRSPAGPRGQKSGRSKSGPPRAGSGKDGKQATALPLVRLGWVWFVCGW